MVYICAVLLVGGSMKIQAIVDLLDAKVLCGGDKLDRVVNSACGCDMMSDVLAFVKEQAVLITGLCNPQVIRTAIMMDMRCIVFVRGKMPPEEVISLADESGLVVLASNERMYTACGKLYDAGLRGGDLIE
jgi:predicted transcriptional regulator